jgi:response regulator RpfG family c-di-GMP phosphodiesterase
MSIDRARREIQQCAGSQFDPSLVEILLSWDLEAFMEELHGLNANDLHLLDERLY